MNSWHLALSSLFRSAAQTVFDVGGKVFVAAERFDLDRHMVPHLLHNRQIEEDLVKRIGRVNIDDGDHFAFANDFPEVFDHAGGLGAKGGIGLFGPNTQKALLRHGRIVFDIEVELTKHEFPPVMLLGSREPTAFFEDFDLVAIEVGDKEKAGDAGAARLEIDDILGGSSGGDDAIAGGFEIVDD